MRSSNYFRFGLAMMAMNVVVGFAAVSSLTLSPDEVASGGSATGKVRLDDVAKVMTSVTLSSSAPAVATVPSSLMIGGKLIDGSFSITTHAAGCSLISAHIGSTPTTSKLLYVDPPPPSPDLQLTLSSTAIRGSSSLTGTLRVTVNATLPATTVQLTSSSENVTVPASLPLQILEGAGGNGAATFHISTSRVTENTCAVITATHNGVQSRALLKVIPFFG